MKGLILVFGSDGMVGSRFVELSPRKNFLHLPTEVELDITNAKEVKGFISRYNFSAIVNFAAYTNVNEAEKQRGDKNANCWKVNVEGIKNLVDAINPNKTHFIQISTDMVFSGSSEDPGPYTEDHPVEEDVNKVTWYGWTKSRGEKYITDNLGKSATIVRIIYPVRANFPPKLDFLRKAIALYDEGNLYPQITDQQFTITYIDEAAKALEKIATNNLKGVFHISCPDTTNAYDLVLYLLQKTRNAEKDLIEKTTLGEFLKETGSLVVRYPKYTGLRVEETQKRLSMNFINSREIVNQLTKQGVGE